MKNYTIALALVITFVTCGKSKTQTPEEVDDSLQQDYYQKSLPFDGLNGKIDSIISHVYEAEGLSRGELVSKDIKRFNSDGYVTIHETRAYDGSELYSAGQTVYIRGVNSLENEQVNNYITKNGTGYTLHYQLIDRELNKETWEVIRKFPSRDIELTAEVREYSKNRMRIFSQIGVSDSVVLKYEYKYLDNGLDSDVLFYDQAGVMRQSMSKRYNDKGNPTTLITQYINFDGSVDYEKKETYEYNYDEKGNPILIKIFDEDTLMGIIENEIHYAKE